jgi:hypothetical protein
MRYHLAGFLLLMLLVMLPMGNLRAAPAPDSYGILEIGSPPPEGWTEEQYLKEEIKFMTSRNILDKVCSDPEVKKLSSVAAMKDARTWLDKNIRGTPEKGRCLRITFRAGKRPEQAAIINAFLRAKLAVAEEFIKSNQEELRRYESFTSKLKSKKPSDTVRNEIHDLRTYRIPRLRTEITRLKQTKVTRWAK